MWLQILSKRITVIILISGLTLSVALFLSFPQKDSIKYWFAHSIKNIVTPPAKLPIRLKILSLNIDASIEYVGLTSNGEMDVPKSPDNVAWFNLGPVPGESGSSVIAGHYGWKKNNPAVFDNLNKINKGDKVFVEDYGGLITTFVVQEMKIYGKDESIPDVFSSVDGKAHLNIVTCTGTWDDIQKSYSHRLVVFTDKE